jgi:hypothetical protein
VPYQGSHVPFLHSQVGDEPTRAERQAAPSGRPLLQSQHRPDRGAPSYHPGQVARGTGRDEATRRLRGSVARSRFHRSVSVARRPLSQRPKIPCQVCSHARGVNDKVRCQAGLRHLLGNRSHRGRSDEQLMIDGQCPKMERSISTVGAAAARRSRRDRGRGCKPGG